MLDMRWRYVHLIFFCTFVGSWFGFALLWWVILLYHGDLEPAHLPDEQEADVETRDVPTVEQTHEDDDGGNGGGNDCPTAALAVTEQQEAADTDAEREAADTRVDAAVGDGNVKMGDEKTVATALGPRTFGPVPETLRELILAS